MKPEFFDPPIDNIAFQSIWKYILSNYSVKDVDYYFAQGTLDASQEVTVFDAKKLYISNNIILTFSTTSPQASPVPAFVFFDNNNAASLVYANSNYFWDVVAANAKGSLNSSNIGPVLFSRINTNNIYSFSFTGLKIILN
jgi:hypothetical protein